MRKHKSAVAILLAVMMIFTFMPTMAFGESGYVVKKWDDQSKYATATAVKGDDEQTFTAKRVFSDGNGLVTATLQDIESGVQGVDNITAPTETASYYDLDGAYFAFGKGTDYSKYKKLDGTTWTQKEFNGQFSSDGGVYGIMLVEPEDTEGYKEAKAADSSYKAKTYFVDLSNRSADGTFQLGAWVFTFDTNLDEYKYNAEADQQVTFAIKKIVPSAGVVIDGTNYADKFGTVASATITVKGTAKTPDTASFYLDEVGGTEVKDGALVGRYDGSAHTVVADATPGYTVSYYVLNTATGKYEKKDAVSVTDVQDAIDFYAVFTDSKGNMSGRKDMTLKLVSTADWRTLRYGRDTEIGFNMAESLDDNAPLYAVPGETYNASDYLLIAAEEVKTSIVSGAKWKDAIRKDNAAAKNAVAANMEEIKAWFNELYEIKDVTTKAQAKTGVAKLQIVEKELTTEEKTAIAKKYEQLIANLGQPDVDDNTVATVKLNSEAVNDYEVEFTNAPSSKVYHVKKAKKLKKAKSFTVTAVANNSKTVAYKLINANTPKIAINKTTGKITLKKGLAKGTYKIKVKAYVPGNSDKAFEVQAITIKIKK